MALPPACLPYLPLTMHRHHTRTKLLKVNFVKIFQFSMEIGMILVVPLVVVEFISLKT